MIPKSTITLTREHARKLINLVDTLEDNDDAQKVYTNADFDDDLS